jgi:hypothetical protein
MNDATRSKRDVAPRFSRQPDGVIVDHERGFEWFAVAGSYNWDEFMLGTGVALPGEGWREPTRAELATLVTRRRNADHLFLDSIFEGTPNAQQVWTSEWGDKPGVVWSFDFGRGKAVEDWTHPTHHLGLFLVRTRA